MMLTLGSVATKRKAHGTVFYLATASPESAASQNVLPRSYFSLYSSLRRSQVIVLIPGSRKTQLPRVDRVIMDIIHLGAICN